MNSREAYIALNMIGNLGPVRVRALVAALGSPEAVFAASAGQLVQARGVGAALAEEIIRQRRRVDPAAEEEKAARLGARIVTLPDDEYPEPLKNIYDPPLALYVKGTLERKDRHAVAVVGTRHATHYGAAVADKLAYQLARCGFAVVSGLARGIDTAAHRGALKAEGRTLAVLGAALDKLYPPENAALAEAIAERGALLSEYALGRAPDRTTFPYRNRVISGLSMGVLVVEAGITSGAMQTATQALDQGRPVFAVPGRIDSSASRGAHRLLKQGARLVDDVDDILQEFDTLLPPEQRRKAAELDPRPRVMLAADEQAIVRALYEGELDVDELARRAGLPIASVNALLLGLEMKRVIRLLSGRRVALAEGLRPAEDGGPVVV